MARSTDASVLLFPSLVLVYIQKLPKGQSQVRTGLSTSGFLVAVPYRVSVCVPANRPAVGTVDHVWDPTPLSLLARYSSDPETPASFG